MTTSTARPLRVGLVGTGAIAHAHLPAYLEHRDQVELVAVCDIREEAASRFAARAGVDAVHTSFADLLARADIDAVDLCTTHDQHAAQVLAAAATGRHVLVEKPMATSLADCRAMVAATAAAGVTYMVGQVFRYLPQSRHVKRLLAAGELGTIWSLRSDDLHLVVPPAADLAGQPARQEAPHWLYDSARSGGGALITFANHHIDLFRYYVGDVSRVSGRCWTGHPMFFHGAEDRCLATLEFASGAIGTVHASYTTRSPWLHRYWLFGEQGTVCSAPNPSDNAAIQHHGRVEVSTARLGGPRPRTGSPTFVDITTDPLDAPLAGLPTDRAFVNEILHFADCCRTGAEPVSSGRDNLATMQTIFAIYESARTGQPIDVNA